MEKFKTYTILLSIVSLILLLVLIFGGKTTVYVCYDGTEKESAKDCSSFPPLPITEKEAMAAMIDYANSFARSRPGVIASVIGEVSRANGSWLAHVTFANSRTGDFDELKFLIDGNTSSITCVEDCDYLKTSGTNTSTANN